MNQMETMFRALADELRERLGTLERRGSLERGPVFLSTGTAHDTPHTITVDLDGTIAEPMIPHDPTKVGPPREGAKEFVQALRQIAPHVLILTARDNLEPVHTWVKEYAIPVTGVTNRKVPALVHIDDRGVNARGNLKDVLAQVHEALSGKELSTAAAFSEGFEVGAAMREQGLELATHQVFENGKLVSSHGSRKGAEGQMKKMISYGFKPETLSIKGPPEKATPQKPSKTEKQPVMAAGDQGGRKRCPAGYTHEHPLFIGGKAFVGGEFIPPDVLESATEEEKASLDRPGPHTIGEKGADHGQLLEDQGGGDRGLPAGGVGGEPGTAPPGQLPAAGEGAGAGPAGLHQGEGVGGDGSAGGTSGRGDAAGVGEGAGPGGDVHLAGSPAESLKQPPTPENPTDGTAGNWRYLTRDFASGSLKDKYRNNIKAIQTLNTLNVEGRDTATPEEQEILSQYVGWGQFPALFNDYNDWQARKDWEKAGLRMEDFYAMEEEGKQWGTEREELKKMLGGDEEWASARRSTLNAHYTHPEIVDAHWQMAKRLGFHGGPGTRFLETSAGAGYYLGMMPNELAGTNSSAVELDKTTGRICQLLYPKTAVNIQGFQEYKSPDDFFDLVASNVPFGNYGVFDDRYNKHKARIHDYFFLKSADVARPGGLIMHITSKGTLDKGDPAIREELAKTCDLVSAIRFPGGAHAENAGTQVVTDMLILRKRLPGEQPGDQTWLKTTTVPDPDGGEAIPINQYFADHPEQVLGRTDRSGTMYRAETVNVSLASPEELTEALGRPVKVFVDEKTGKRHLVFADSEGAYERVPGADVQRVGQELFRLKLREAVERVPEGIYTKAKPETEHWAPERLPAPGEVKDGGYHIKDGKLFQRQAGALIEQKSNKTTLPRIEGQLAIRDAMREIVNLESAGSDSTAARAKLNEVYDTYVANHGFLHEKMNRRAMAQDPDHPNLLSLENWDGKTGVATKGADMFRKETIRHIQSATSASNAAEGLGISLHENGRVDIEHIARLTGQHKDAIAKELVANGHAFEDPQHGWKPADQYLSGNVRQKLVMARAAAAADPKFKANVEALERVQPEDVEHTDIDVRLGAPWVPPADIAAFAAHLTGHGVDDFIIGHHKHNGEWVARTDGNVQSEAWSSPGANFIDLLGAALNNKPITIYAGKDDKGKPIVDLTKTRDAQAKVQDIKDAFYRDGTGWIWEDDKRRERLHRYYNDNFNNVRPIKYDGSHQTFPGLNPNFTPHPHIPNFVWQVVSTGKGFAGHEVGTGKTAAMIMAAMELRRLGLARKPAVACLKANIEQVTQEALRLYPGAKIITTQGNFDAKQRQRIMARIASGDYDMVIMTHDHLNKLRMKPDVTAKFIKEELDDLIGAKLAAIKDGHDPKGRIVKDLEKAQADLEVRLKEALNEKVKDNTVFFEDTGIDHLMVDESHYFKALPCYTRMGQVKGIPQRRSQRATNMLMRTRWLLDRNGDRGVVFATGTPITNTMGEMFNNMRYLQPKDLKERGVEAFDSWASTFGDIAVKGEFNVAGQYKPTARFRNFTNVNELMQIAGQVLDVQRVGNMKKAPAEGITLGGREFKAGQAIPPQFLDKATDEERAKLVNTIHRPARRDHDVVSPDSPAMRTLMERLKARADVVAHMTPDERRQKGSDNMLAICTDGRKGALDMRLLDPAADDDPNSKTNKAVNNVLAIAKANPGQVQLIFSDLGVHETGVSKRAGGKMVKAGAEHAEEDVAAEDTEDEKEEADPEDAEKEQMKAGRFNLYADVINKLVAGGIPREKIADFSQLEGSAKEESQAALRRGDMIVGIGSSKKMGTGVNVQDRIHTMHHLDVPWLPAELEQRDGRGWRYGNKNKEVNVVRYLAEKSLDQKFWDTLSAKAGFIRQIMESGGKGIRTIKDEDTETLSYEQLTAIASGDKRVMEKVEVEEEVKNLGFAEQRHSREQARLKRSVEGNNKRLAKDRETLVDLEKDIANLQAHPDFEASVGDQQFAERKEADAALKAGLENFRAEFDKLNRWDTDAKNNLEETPIGTYRGMTVYPARGTLGGDGFRIAGPSGERWPTGPSLQSIEHVARNIPARKPEREAWIKRTEADIATTKTKIGGEFRDKEMLAKKRARLAQLEAELKQADQSVPTEETYSGGPAPGEKVGGGSSVGAIAAAAQKEPPKPKPEPNVMNFGKKHFGKTFEQIEQDQPDYLDWVAKDADYAPEDIRKAVQEYIAKRPPKVEPAPAPAPEPETGSKVTEEQREAVHQALKQLHADNEDKAAEKNGRGFNKFDSEFGGRLAETPRLTDRQVEHGAKLVGKYKGQLGEDLHRRATTAGEPAATPPVAVKKSLHSQIADEAERTGRRLRSKEAHDGRTVYMVDDDELSPGEMLGWLKRLADKDPTQLATAHAPAGGINIAGTQFVGGEFIPGEHLAKATPEQKAQLGVKDQGLIERDKAKAENAEKWKPDEKGIIHPKDSLGIPRSAMPQIAAPHVPEFLHGLQEKGIGVKSGAMKVSDLKPTQADLSAENMEQIGKKLPPEKLRGHVIVSKDNYVLDGHHRWAELHRQDPNGPINVHKVDLPIHDLLRHAHAFDKVTYKDTGTGKALPPIDKVKPLPDPTPGDAAGYLKKAMEHPYVQEAERRLKEGAQTKDTEVKWDKRPGSTKDRPVWDPERVKSVHEPIINHFVNPAAKAKPGERPKAVFLIGPFGAGKSVAGEPIVKKMMPNYTLINPDEVKQRMPEDEGWNATHLHEESSHISKQIAARARAEQHHLLYDGSGQNGEKMSKLADELHGKGYDVHVVHVTVPKEVSLQRATNRFLENPFGMRDGSKKPTRYAPLQYIHDEVDSKPDGTYEQLKKNPHIKSGRSYSTHGVQPGQQAPLRDSFDRDAQSLSLATVQVTGGHWITLKAKDGGGGTHVYIGGSGKIEKGPNEMVGKSPHELSEHSVSAVHGESKPEPENPGEFTDKGQNKEMRVGAEGGAGKNGRRLPKTEKDANDIAVEIREQMVGDIGSKDQAENGQCVSVAHILLHRFPDAEIWAGNYEQNPEQYHVIAKLGDYFIDITADQFPGGNGVETKVFTKREMEPGEYAEEYGGFRRSRGFEQSSRDSGRG